MGDLEIAVYPRIAAVCLTCPANLRKKGRVANGHRGGTAAISLFGSKNESFVGPPKQINCWNKGCLASVGKRNRVSLSRGRADQ